MAKLFAARSASKVASMGVQIHGGYGYSKDYPIERYFRDARVTRFTRGPTRSSRSLLPGTAKEKRGVNAAKPWRSSSV